MKNARHFYVKAIWVHLITATRATPLNTIELENSV